MEATVEKLPVGEVEDPGETFEDGPFAQLTFEVGGHVPTSSTLVLKGGAIELPDGAEYRKGQRITLSIEAVISEVAFSDKTDAETGDVTGCKRKHAARIDGFRVV